MVNIKLKSIQQAFQANTLHHALLFAGEDLNGQWQTAKSVAQYILCHQRQAFDVCGTCSSCRYFTQLAGGIAETNHENAIVHPDLYLLGEESAESISIDHIREIIDFLALTPHQSARKVVLIKNSDRLNIASQNALLKILEEPPAYGQFILCTARTQLLLPTIISRTMQFQFPVPSLSDGVHALKARLEAEHNISMLPDVAALKALVFLAGGNVEKAAEWLEMPVWASREAIVNGFVLGKLNQSTNLHQIAHQHALETLYLLYAATGDLIRYWMNPQAEDIYILNRIQLRAAVLKMDLKACFGYLSKLQQAIKDVQQTAGLNKILMFQDLYCFLHKPK